MQTSEHLVEELYAGTSIEAAHTRADFLEIAQTVVQEM